MNFITIGGAFALSLVLAACGGTEAAGTESRQSANAADGPDDAAQVHSATGTVKVVAGDQVTIAHGAIQSIGWPAMTMSFKAPISIRQGVRVGTRVNFSFRQDGSDYALTSLQPR